MFKRSFFNKLILAVILFSFIFAAIAGSIAPQNKKITQTQAKTLST